ncbi:MAG TPA: carboxypeptidase-like regulatory domain-containing protein, partial [Pyrinomonadaceae bacterium]
MSRIVKLSFVMLLVLGLSVVVMAQSQASSGTITGLVTDANGAVVPNASVKAKNKQTGLERTATASGEGLYNIVLLPPGTYTLTAEASGFAAATVDDVVVTVG